MSSFLNLQGLTLGSRAVGPDAVHELEDQEEARQVEPAVGRGDGDEGGAHLPTLDSHCQVDLLGSGQERNLPDPPRYMRTESYEAPG
jgi:hypothetical protein